MILFLKVKKTKTKQKRSNGHYMFFLKHFKKIYIQTASINAASVRRHPFRSSPFFVGEGGTVYTASVSEGARGRYDAEECKIILPHVEAHVLYA